MPPPDLIAKGDLAHIPLMVSGNSCDAIVYGADALALFTFAEPKGQPFEALYPRPQADAVQEAQSDRIENEPVRFQARAQVEAAMPVWAYYFDYRKPGAACRGALHGAELPYVFGNLHNRLVFPSLHNRLANAENADRKLSQEMMGYWVAFAKRGSPNAPDLPNWPGCSNPGNPVLHFSEKGTMARKDFRKPQLDWIESKLTSHAIDW